MMQKAEKQQVRVQTASRQMDGLSMDSPYGDRIAQLQSMIDSSPLMAAQRRKIEAVAQREVRPSANVTQLATKCNVKGEFTEIPSGDLGAEYSPLFGGKWGKMFNMKAEFTPEDSSITDGDCSSGEFRQYVKGKFVLNDKTLKHYIYDGEELDESTYKLDGPYGHYYGEKGWKDGASRYIYENNKTKFNGFDYPGLRVEKGESGEIDLSFKANLIDTRQGGKILAESLWTVKGASEGEK